MSNPSFSSEDPTAAVEGSRQILVPSPALRRSELVATTTTEEMKHSPPPADNASPMRFRGHSSDRDEVDEYNEDIQQQLGRAVPLSKTEAPAGEQASSSSWRRRTPPDVTITMGSPVVTPPRVLGSRLPKPRKPATARAVKRAAAVGRSVLDTLANTAGIEDARIEMACDADSKDKKKEVLNPRSPPLVSDCIPDVFPVLCCASTGGKRIAVLIGLMSVCMFWLGYIVVPLLLMFCSFGCTFPAGLLGIHLKDTFLGCTLRSDVDMGSSNIAFNTADVQSAIQNRYHRPIRASNTGWVCLLLAYWFDRHATWVGAQRSCIIGWIVKVGYFIQDETLVDIRADHVQSSKHADSRAVLIVAKYIESASGDTLPLLYSPAMMEQSATRMELASAPDMFQMVQQHTSRITNQMIHGSFLKPVVSDSSFVAECYNTHERLRHSMLKGLAVGTNVAGQWTLWAAGAACGLMVLHSLTPHLWKVPAWVATSAPMFVPWARSAVVAVSSIFHLPASVIGGAGIAALDLCLLVPAIEESVKTAMFLCGVPHSSFMFGAWEFAIRVHAGDRMYDRIAPFMFHTMLDSMPLMVRVPLHVAWNVLSVILGQPRQKSASLIGRPVTYICRLLGLTPTSERSQVQKLYGFGYRDTDNIDLPDLRESLGSVHLLPNFGDSTPRRPMQVGLGPTVEGIACPMVDRNHGPTVLRGCNQRYMAVPPKATRASLRRLKKYVEFRVKHHFEPISFDADLSVDTWLAGTTYTEERKIELRRVWDEALHTLTAKHREVAGHCKDETYMAYKDARGINSRSDAFKVFCGPYFKLMETEVYKDKAFIKHVPVRQRPQYILDMLGPFVGVYYETDYTTFEALFESYTMECIEMVLYKHMLTNFPDVYDEIHTTMCGENKCKYNSFVVKVRGKRMSGEMCTSLGNGFSNLMLAEFIAHEQGHTITGVVEGDDGLFATRANFTSEMFADLGFNIKILEHHNLLRTSFCGLMMSDDLITLTDPRKVIANFGWTHSALMWGGPKVRLGLLRAKAMSLLYEHPRCPILSALAKRYIRLTEGIAPRFSSNWYDQHLAREVAAFTKDTLSEARLGPSLQSRNDFEGLYGISVHQQIAAETYLTSAGLAPLTHWSITSLFNEAKYDPLWHYGANYVSESCDAF